MAFTPTPLLSLPLIDTGTESGTWGELVDNGLTSYLDIAIAGGLAVSVVGTTTVTLTNTAGTSSVTNIGATTAQYAILNISGAKTGACNLVLPSSSRRYTINNAGTSTGGPFLLTVKGAATTGVTLQDGEKAIVAWNGTDYVKVAGLSQTNNVSYTSFLTETSTTLTNKPTLQFERTGAQTNGTGNAGYISFKTNGPSAIGTYEAAKFEVTYINQLGILGTAKIVMGTGNSVGTYPTRIEIDGATENGTISNVAQGRFTWGSEGNESMIFDAETNLQLATGALMPYAPAPVSISGATTLTAANILAQIINTTGTTYTVTMPTGTTIETVAGWAATNIAYDFYIVNTASGTITIAVNTGVTALGSLTIATGVSAHFRMRKTANNTFVLYRLS